MNAGIFTKEDNDRFSVRSHNLAAKAQEDGFFKGEIVPIMAHAEGDEDIPLLIEHDTSVRKNATYEGTKDLRALSKPGWDAGTGPLPMTVGSTTPKPIETIRASGSRSCFFIASSDINNNVAAPAFVGHEFPAVTNPYSVSNALTYSSLVMSGL